MQGSRLAPWLAGALALVAGGCHETAKPQARTTLPTRECVQAWNAGGNERNRGVLLRSGFTAGQASEWKSIADFGVGQTPTGDTTRDGCSYLFHSDTRYASFSGTWEEAATLVWDGRLAGRGRWSVSQQENTRDELRVRPDGRIELRDLPVAPAGPAPRPATKPAPPPAWLETRRGARWLAYSTWCRREGCVDYPRPRCVGDAARVPTLLVDRGELVRVHLGHRRSPRMVLLTFRGQREHQTPVVLRPRLDAVWRAEQEGAFELLALERRGRTTSYAGCLRFAPASISAASRPGSVTLCGRAVVEDLWLDGVIASTYHSTCYAWALDHPPPGGWRPADPRPQLEALLAAARLREQPARGP